MNGILVIDKPVGPTSHDVVSQIRSALSVQKVGHTGTLDPMATGILPLVLGRATKVAQFLTGRDKTYRATIRLGISTDTLDAEGSVTAERPVDVTETQAKEAVERFHGAIDQIPPMYSAKKIRGERLYEMARRGEQVERDPKRVTIHDIAMVDFAPPEIVIEVRCSAGTYVRTLADDIGQTLGCGGHLSALRRTDAGPFGENEAVPLADAVADPELARAKVIPVADALSDLPRINLPEDLGRMIASGHQLSVADLRTLDTPEYEEGNLLTLHLDSGELLAVARALIASQDLAQVRRDLRGIKTERVLWRAEQPSDG